jgi:hypothetical protein
MSKNLNLPFFPNPPADYQPSYLAELGRSFSSLLTQLQNAGEERSTRLTLTNLPNNDAGLEVGALFERNGFVKITLVYSPNPYGVSGSGGVGSVTVTTA